MNSISRMPPGPSFTLSLQLAPLDLAGDHRLHLAQALVDAVVEVAPVHEGAHDVVVERAVARGAGDRARLHPGVALPVAAVLLQVVLERAEVHGERARLAERPQAHVHAEHEALGGARIEQPDQRLAEAREVLLVRDLARAVGLAALGVEEDEVDVRGEVELAAAELAHADDDEFLRLAGRRPRRAIARRERARREVERGADRRRPRAPKARAASRRACASPARSRQAMRTSSCRRRRRSASMNAGSSPCAAARPDATGLRSRRRRAHGRARRTRRARRSGRARALRTRARNRWRRRRPAAARGRRRAVRPGSPPASRQRSIAIMPPGRGASCRMQPPRDGLQALQRRTGAARRSPGAARRSPPPSWRRHLR